MARRYWDSWYPNFPASVPRAAKGGIRAQAKKGKFATSWWGKRWIEVLDSFHIGARLERGMKYARSGQVLNLEISAGEVRSSVQGSRATPYKVLIQLEPLRPDLWTAVARQLGKSPLLVARLLNGEMPEQLEAAFLEVRAPLFPKTRGDLKTDCSCPDWSNPCKHIAAVYYLLAEAFDKDPFLLLALRGKDRAGFLALAGVASPGSSAHPSAPSEADPLPARPGEFWGEHLEPARLPPAGIVSSDALVRRLGPLPFWRGREGFLETMTAAYRSAADGIPEKLREDAGREEAGPGKDAKARP